MLPTMPPGQHMAAHPRGLPSEQAPAPHPKHTWLLILVFCLFAGLIAETFVTASTSPVHFLLNPFTIPFNIVFYGTFDLLAREILVRRHARLVRVVLLGAAYGLINEGVAAGTWYVVHPQGYIFIGGIDWAWALVITLFHMIMSVIVPIAFLEILFPSTHGQPLLNRWGITACVVLLLGCIVTAILLLAPLPLSILPYRLTVLVVAVLFSLVALAAPLKDTATVLAPSQSTPANSPNTPEVALSPQRLPGLWQLRSVGFLAIFAFFFLSYLFPAIIAEILKSRPSGLVIAQGIDCAVFLAFGAIVVVRGWTWSQRAGWSPRQNLALLLGGVTFTTLLLNVTEAPMGEIFSTLPFYAFLLVLTFRWRVRTSALRATPLRNDLLPSRS